MLSFSHTRRLCAALCSLALGAQAAQAAGDDEAINPDRPSVGQSSQVVGRGRVQLEAGLQWERQRDDELHQRTLNTPTLLRVGLDERTELRVETEGRTVIHATDPSSGERSTTAGYADTSVGIKWHLADGGQGDGARRPSLGLIVQASLPSGSRALRGKGLRPSLSLPAEWELAHGYTLALMPGVGIDSDERDARYGYGVLAASLVKEASERLHGFVELAAPRIAGPSHGGTQAVFDAGLSYLVSRDCQLDAIVLHGLNRRTPDLSLGFGISVRR